MVFQALEMVLEMILELILIAHNALSIRRKLRLEYMIFDDCSMRQSVCYDY